MIQLRITIVAPTEATAAQYAELATWARQHGLAFSNCDLRITTATIELGGKLLAYDADF